METNKYNKYMNDDYRVDIKGFFTELKKKWFLILIGALLFGIVFSMAVSIRQNQKLKTAQNNVTISLSETEQKQIEQIRDLQTDLADMENYKKESLLMNIDSYQEAIVNLSYYVNGSGGNAADFIYACKQYIELSGIVQDIGDQFSVDCESKYIGELLSFRRDTDESGNLESNSFSVVVVGRNETEVKELAALVNAAILKYAERQKNNFQEIGCTLVDELYSVKVDNNLKNLQNQARDVITNCRLKIDELTSVLTEDQAAELANEEERDISQEVANTAAKAGINVKYMLAGAVLGAIVSVCVILCIYLFKGVVSTEVELMRIFGLRVIGRLKEKSTAESEIKQAAEELTAGIHALCLAKKVSDIYILNTLTKDMNPGFMNEVCGAMQKKGIHVTVGKRMSEYPDEITEFAKNPYVILLVRLRETKYDMICESLTMCDEFKAEALGCIALK